MPNYCNYQMKVKGNSKNINEFISMMNYTHPQKQFYRVFAADVYESGDGYVCISGDVAWSVYCAFLQISCKCERTDKEFTLISDVSKELQLEIEIYSSEPGMCFQEHFLFDKGETIYIDCLDFYEYWYDDMAYEGETDEEKFAAFLEDIGLNITPEDLDENGNYCIGGFENFGVWTI